MKKTRKLLRYRLIKYLICISLISSLGGCALINSTQYNTKEEAERATLKHFEDKYDRKFTLVGDGTIEESKGIEFFKTKFKDEDGLEAEAVFTKDKNIGIKDVLNSGVPGNSDTYSEVIYTKKTRDAIEPLFEDEPFEKYFISLASAELSKKDLSLSADEYLKKTGDEYELFVILPDNKDAEFYAKIIHPFYEKLIHEQTNNFLIAIYANKKQIFVASFINAEGFNCELSYDDVLEKVSDGLEYNQPQPEEIHLQSKYYNGENN